MKIITIPKPWLGISDFGGWGNGYVLIPVGHPLHSVAYDEIDVDVHGGLTYGRLVEKRHFKIFGLKEEDLGSWIVGFDTVHHGDDEFNWPEIRVIEETEKLRDSLINYPAK